MGDVKTTNEASMSGSATPAGSQYRNYMLNNPVLSRIVQYVLTKHFSGKKGHFLDDVIDLHSACFTADSDRKEPVDFGFIEDKVMMACDFAKAIGPFRKTVDAEGGNISNRK